MMAARKNRGYNINKIEVSFVIFFFIITKERENEMLSVSEEITVGRNCVGQM